MKGNEIKILIFEILIILGLFINNFVSSILSGYLEVLFLLIVLGIFYLIFGFSRDRHHLWRNTCFEIIIFLLIFFISYYILGLLVSFTKPVNYYTFNGFKDIIIPIILIIITKEILRYMIVAKTYGNKILLVLACMMFILIDLVGRIDLSSLTEKFEIFVFISTIILPTISRNILCTYLTYKVGYKPVILYLLVTTLFAYLLPLIPNPNQYIYSVIWLIVPLILLYRLHIYFKKEKHDVKVERKDNKAKVLNLVLPLVVVVILVYFISGYFHYHAIVVASGSMETAISKGDIVVIKKIEGNTDLLKINQVIAYNYDKKIVVHRLVKIIEADGDVYYYTKGDANNAIDNYKITEDMIIGIVDYKIPYIGYPTVWINEL